jgi:L-alanine-DL-glutamate epimerase-like enolase superfamily enzyme
VGAPLATKPRRVAAKQFAAPLPHEDAEVVGWLLEEDLSCTIVDQRDLEVRVKITGIETYPVWGGERNYLFVVVDTDEGVYGVGEAGLTGRELAVTGAIGHFEPLLLGQDPFRSEHLWQLLFRGGFFPARHAVSAAISAVDLALWDIKGKALGVPVYELLGGRARDRVVCYPHNTEAGADTSALVESCLKTKEDGHLLPPARPGLGVEFDREAAKSRPFRMADLPRLHRTDGSVTNW